MRHFDVSAGLVLSLASLMLVQNAFERRLSELSERVPASESAHPIPKILRPLFPPHIREFQVKGYEAFFLSRRLDIVSSRKGAAQIQAELISYKKFLPKKFLSAAQERCFWIVASGGTECFSDSIVRELVSRVDAKSDLLTQSRQVAQSYGMRMARDFVAQALLRQDEGGGDFESRVLEATRNTHKVFDDSVLNMPSARKARTGIYFIAGFNHDRGVSADVMDAAAAHLRWLGFASERLIVSPAGAAPENARRVRETLESSLSRLDSIILVGLSKGSSDLSYFVTRELPRARPELKRKLKVMVSLSGVVREAFVPGWMSREPGPTTALMRTYMARFLPEDHKEWDGLESMADDYWVGYKKPSTQRQLLWINFPMIPESPRGMPEKKQALRLATALVTKANSSYGPHDGLVETGASILPPGTGHRQWIIRALGDHGLIDGLYISGEPVSRQFVATADNVKAGVELIDAFVRALPSDVLVGD